MANDEKGLFWNSENGDRTYNADSFSNWLRKFFTTGVFQDECQVTSIGSMVVQMDIGYCNIEGKVQQFEQEQQFTVDVANSTYPRIDTIVIERNDVDREISAKYIVGQYSADSPVPTAPVRDGGVYQIVLAQIYVGAGVTALTQADITDTRPNAELCGWVAGTVEQIDLEQILSQSQTQFNEWFATIQDILDQDTAGHLQSEIYDLQNAIDEINPSVIDITLEASNWSNAEYIITNSELGGSERTKWITYPTTATDDELDEIANANIRVIAETTGSITLKARGNVPSENIPIQIVISGRGV